MVEFDQMWFIFHHSLPCSPHTSIGVAALRFMWYKALILIIKKVLNCRYDLIISLILLPSQVFFFHVGEQKIVRWCQIRRIWRVIKSSKSQSHTAAIATTDLCARALWWWKRTPFVSLPGSLRNVSSTTFQSPEVLIKCGFIWKKITQLVSGKVEVNACQVSLLLHN